MPDLVFNLKRNHQSVLSSQDRVFIECKCIDKDKPLGTYYCKKGINRFITGDYAWAMQEALMVAYIRRPASEFDFGNKLKKTLEKKIGRLQL